VFCVGVRLDAVTYGYLHELGGGSISAGIKTAAAISWAAERHVEKSRPESPSPSVVISGKPEDDFPPWAVLPGSDS
jgi:hypothetical protein